MSLSEGLAVKVHHYSYNYICGKLSDQTIAKNKCVLYCHQDFFFVLFFGVLSLEPKLNFNVSVKGIQFCHIHTGHTVGGSKEDFSSASEQVDRQTDKAQLN